MRNRLRDAYRSSDGTPSISRIVVLLTLLAIVAVGCGGGRDDRDGIRNTLGEPDHIQYTEGLTADLEIWTYFDYPETGMNKEYRFQRSKNVCGGSDNWVLSLERTYTPASGEEEIRSGTASSDSNSRNPIKP